MSSPRLDSSGQFLVLSCGSVRRSIVVALLALVTGYLVLTLSRQVRSKGHTHSGETVLFDTTAGFAAMPSLKGAQIFPMALALLAFVFTATAIGTVFHDKY